MKKTTLRLDEEVVEAIKSQCERHGDFQWLVNKALKAAFCANAKKKSSAKPKFDPIEYGYTFDGLYHDAWGDWCDKRKSMKKPITQRAAKGQIELLLRHRKEVQLSIIRASIDNDYQGLFEPKGGVNGQQKQSLSERSARSTVEALKNLETAENLLGQDESPLWPQVGFEGR